MSKYGLQRRWKLIVYEPSNFVFVWREQTAQTVHHMHHGQGNWVHTQRVLVHNDNGYLPKLDFITVCTLHKIEFIDKCLR